MQDTPLVSVLCRTVGRNTLGAALQSVSDQDWPRLEIVLVDALGQGRSALPVPTLRNDIDLHLVAGPSDEALDRPQAANAALDAARGDLLLFLDDDDWLAPDQIRLLAGELSAHPNLVACYSATRKTLADGTPTDETIAVPFDHALLRRDNFMPIHAVLFRRSVLKRGCRFDESLAVYEDWDFWLQVAELGPLKLLPHEGAYYRQGGDSQTMLEEHRARYDAAHPMGQARARVLHKWRERWSGADWNALLGLMDQQIEVAALNKDLAQVGQQLNVAAQRIAQLEQDLDHRQQSYAELEAAHRALHSAHEQLTRDLRAILASFSWRVTSPYRWLRRRLNAMLGTQRTR